MTEPEYKAVVFAGGGSRCAWQVGFWTEAAPALNLAPRTVVGVSAGASMAALLLAGRAEFALSYMKKAMAANSRNIYPLNVLSGKPIFPHFEIYKRAVIDCIDRTALARLHQGPDLKIVLSRPPAWLGPRLAVALGFSCYLLERKIKYPVHPRLAGKVGFAAEAVRARDCRTPEDLAELLIASSCTPPLTPVMKWNGGAALDGGLVDNVPVAVLEPDASPALVLLTRRFPEKSIPKVPGRRYVQPSTPIAASKWDYTDPQGLQRAFDLGRRDGEAFARSHGRPGGAMK
ncbi:MAG: patatin-like phospholipase family protein [Pseudomonadota bacterium]